MAFCVLEAMSLVRSSQPSKFACSDSALPVVRRLRRLQSEGCSAPKAPKAPNAAMPG